MMQFINDISWSSVASIMFGAAISAVVSYLLQRNSFAEARRQKEADRFEVRKAQAYSLFFKMIRIHSTIVITGAAISESLAKAKAKSLEGALWQIVIPFANLPPRVKFSSDEMALLLSLDYNLFNDVGPYDDVHNSLLDQIELYGVKRGALMEKFGAKMTGTVGVTNLTQSDVDWMAPRTVELNGLVSSIINRIEHDSAESKGLLERIHALFVKEFKMNPKKGGAGILHRTLSGVSA
jgi:hypothetical protein